MCVRARAAGGSRCMRMRSLSRAHAEHTQPSSAREKIARARRSRARGSTRGAEGLEGANMLSRARVRTARWRPGQRGAASRAGCCDEARWLVTAPPRIGAASPCIVVTLPIEGVGVCANASVCVGCVCVCGGRNSDWGSRLSARCQVVLAALCRLRYVGGKVSTLMVRPTTRRQGLLKQAAGESRATDVPMRCVFLLAAALGTKPGALALPLPHTHRTDTFGLHPS